MTAFCAPGAASSCAVEMTSRMRSGSPRPVSSGTRARMRWSALTMMTWRPVALPHDGIRPGRMSCSRSMLMARSCRTAVMRSMRSARMSASAAMSRFIVARFCRVWSITCTKAPRQMVIEEGDDQGGHGPAQRRLGGEQPVIGRLRDRLRQSLDRIGLDARVRRMRTRHALDPRRILFCTPFSEEPHVLPNHSDLNPVFPGCRESTIR